MKIGEDTRIILENGTNLIKCHIMVSLDHVLVSQTFEETVHDLFITIEDTSGLERGGLERKQNRGSSPGCRQISPVFPLRNTSVSNYFRVLFHVHAKGRCLMMHI
jgi:hypothetical protein